MRTTTTTTKTEMAQKCLLDKICKNCSQNMVRVLLKQLLGERAKNWKKQPHKIMQFKVECTW